MARTALDLRPEERQAYRPDEAIRQRRLREDAHLEARWQQAHRLARRAAKLLHEEFGAERVVLFGSLAHRAWFTEWSDIDLAAWGIPPDRFFAAVAAVTDLSTSFQIDLVDPEQCSSHLRKSIQRDGQAL